MDNKLRIVWHSNANWAGSGYGQQTDIFTKLLAEGNHDVKVSAFYGLMGAKLNLADNLQVLPGGASDYGADMILPHYQQYKPDAMVLLIDPWVYPAVIWESAPLVSWMPIDSEPISPVIEKLLPSIRHVWAMSRFGERQIRALGHDCYYVPHGIDTQTFAPSDRKSARELVRLTCSPHIGDDTFLFVTVAANKGFPSRKNLPNLMKAFAALLAKHPEADVHLYLHTNAMPTNSGLDIDELARFYGVPKTRYSVPKIYKYMQGDYTPEYLNQLYNAADAFILPSAGEGFGIPAVEAQASGCPVILSDYTAQTELCGAGLLIPVDRLDDTTYTMMHTEQAINLRPSSILAAMETAMSTWRGNDGLRHKARDWSLQYDARTVFDKYMMPALKAIAAQIPKPLTSVDKYEALGNDYHWSEDYQTGHYAEWVQRVLSHLPADGAGATVLDVGCGDGYPASKLIERGFSVHGVDPVAGALTVARTKNPTGTFTTDYPDTEFDYVVALDSIEHMDDPSALVSAIKKCRRFGLISTPPAGIDQHAVRGYGYAEIAALFPDHEVKLLHSDPIDQLFQVITKPIAPDPIEDELKPRVAVLSDCRLPTTGDGAHGLGNSAHTIAFGLAEIGYRVTLFGGEGSQFDAGELVIDTDEVGRAHRLAETGNCPFDAVIDCSHEHLLSQLRPDLPIINRVGDCECSYRPPNAVVSTKYMQARYGGTIVPTGIKLRDIPEMNGKKRGEHLLFMARMHAHKGIATAQQVSQLANVPIQWAGPVDGAEPPEGVYLGELRGAAKWEALQSARALILPTTQDAAPRTPLEAAAAGVPSLVMAYDGAAEHVKNGVTGYVCRDVAEMAERVSDCELLNAREMRQWVAQNHSFTNMIDGYERLVLRVILGERW